MRLARRALLAAAAGTLAAPRAIAADLGVTVGDHAGRQVVVRDASRLVSVGGDLTEIVFALNAEDALVGVDSTSQFPAAAQALRQVGYMRQLSAEGLLSLRPSLVIATTAAGPPAIFDQLRDAGVATLVLAETHDPAGVVNKIRGVGTALGRSAQAHMLADRCSAELAALEARLETVSERPPRVLFLLAMGQGAPQAAGQQTSADAVIRLARGRNAIDGYRGYRPVSGEGAVSATPDAILVTDQTLAAVGGLDRLLGNAALQITPAGRARRILALDSQLLLGFGPRTAQAVRQVAMWLYPGRDLGGAG